MQLEGLMGMQGGTGHDAVSKFAQLGSLGRQKSSCCRSYRGHVHHHICGRQGLQKRRVALNLWRCVSRERGTAGGVEYG
jgi:hypothetical protein